MTLCHFYLWPKSGTASSLNQNTAFKEHTRGEQSVASRPRVVADTASKIVTATTKYQYIPLPMLFLTVVPSDRSALQTNFNLDQTFVKHTARSLLIKIKT